MTKVIGMLVALAMFCAMPAVAFAGTSEDGNAVGGDNSIDQGGSAGSGGSGGDGTDDDGGGGGEGGDGEGDGGDNNQQAAICSQTTADGDNDCEIDQSINGGGEGGGEGDGGGDGDDGGEGGGDSSDDDDVTSSGGGTGGGSVESVTLAQTGFDAWVLALIGGLSLAGGLGLLAAQRRGRLNA